MRRILLAATLTALVAAASPAFAQLKGAKSAKLTLVEAMCQTGTVMGEKCNPATFLAGSVSLRTQRQPSLYNSPKPLKAGTIKIKGLTPPPGESIYCEESATTTFGSDPDGNCILAGLYVYSPAASGTISCTPSGDCAGDIFAVTLLPDGGCTNVKMTVERPEVACWLTSQKTDAEKLVQNGLAVLAGPDCESGC
jgi:hypothetical protein